MKPREKGECVASSPSCYEACNRRCEGRNYGQAGNQLNEPSGGSAPQKRMKKPTRQGEDNDKKKDRFHA